MCGQGWRLHSIWASLRGQGWGGIPQMNNFEHVGGRTGSWGVLKWTNLNRSWGPHVTCDWPIPSWVVVTWGPPPLFEQPDTAENITFPQARYAGDSKCLARKIFLREASKMSQLALWYPILRLNNIIRTSTYCLCRLSISTLTSLHLS